jgi:7-cyano-7-deazaguanine reductase
MARKPTARSEFVMFDVFYVDGSQRSNRKVDGNLLGGLDGDEPAKAAIEEQDRVISESPACRRSRSSRSSARASSMSDLQLGRAVEAAAQPEDAVLDPVPNPRPDIDYVARYVAPEFTSLCPVTGQPDFAHLVIDYIPDQLLVESKSLKLYLTSFRNHGAFHEGCTIDIAKKIIATIAPRWLRIGGYWYPRGGIPIDVFFQTGPAPEGVWIPDQGVAPYRGRG